MAKEKHVWTVNIASYDFFSSDVKYRSEHVYESLADALHRISVWYNMKTTQQYDVTIENNDVRNDEATFVARNESKREYEELILQKVEYHTKKTAEP